MGLPVDGVCIHSPKQDSFARLAAKHEQSAVEANLPQQTFLTRSRRYDMKNVRVTEDAILSIFDKMGDAKPKRISSLMEKLNRKRIYMSDNRVISG